MISWPRQAGKTLASGIIANRFRDDQISDDTPSYCTCDGVWAVMDTTLGVTLCLMCKNRLATQEVG